MRIRDLNVSLEDGGNGPLYIRVAEAVLAAIRKARVPAGVLLPGVRDLAERLGVHYNTVLVALRELETQGWVEAKPSSGFAVSQAPREPSSRIRADMATTPGFDVPARLAPITDARNLVMDMSEGVADARLAPTDALAQAYQRGLRLKGPTLLGSSDPKGLLRLREGLCNLLSQQRALPTQPEQILVLRSSAFAVSLVAQALIGREEGHVAVENPGSPNVWETVRQASSAQLHPLPVDAKGLDPDALEALLSHTRLNLLILTPQCHFPTGVRLDPARRKRVLELARHYRFPILEMDPEFDYLPASDPMPRPLAAEDTTGQVLYVGSLSRLLAPGIRVAFLAVPTSLSDRLAKARQRMDWQGDPALEWAVSELLVDGEITRHQRRIRKAALERHDALRDALEHTFRDRLHIVPGRGAMALWLKGIGRYDDATRFKLWIRACGMKGLKLRPGSYYDFEGRENAFTRMGFTGFTPEELQQAVDQMAM